MPRSHRLLVTAKIIPPKKYKKFLYRHETTTGLLSHVDVQIKNIGKNEFPGGVFDEEDLRLETAIGMKEIVITGTVTPPGVKSLKPEGTYTIDIAWNAWVPGPSRVVMQMKAVDKGKIGFFRSLEGSPSEEWSYIFNVVDRHQLDLALLLSKLLEKR